MVIDDSNHYTWEEEAGDEEFQVSLGYRVKPCLKNI